MAAAYHVTDHPIDHQGPLLTIAKYFDHVPWGKRIADLLLSCLDGQSGNVDMYRFFCGTDIEECSFLYQFTQFYYPNRSCDAHEFERYYHCVFSAMFNEGVMDYCPIADDCMKNNYIGLLPSISSYLMTKGYIIKALDYVYKDGFVYVSFEVRSQLFAQLYATTSADIFSHYFIEDGKRWLNLFYLFNHFSAKDI